MDILITGIHGFVGTNLVCTLKNQHTIYGLDIVTPYKEGVKQTFRWDDLDNKELPAFDIIIHLAGKAHDTKNKSQADVYFKINTDLTKKIYDFFLKSRAQKFIFFSSVKAAADSVDVSPLTEEVIPSPIGPYGESKIAAENFIIANEPERELKQKQVYILRPCMIHGPGNKGNLNLLYQIVSKRIPWPLGAFDNKRSFTSIDNLCYILSGLIEKNVQSGIYHIGDDEALSTNELIQIMCEAMGRKPHVLHVNRKFMELIAILGTWIHLPLNSERLRKLTENYVVSNAKIKEALGISKMPITAKEGLLKTLQSFENK